ncbi:MAG: cbb3-type cytochrome oxidase assembly protein CcoS [Piscinibacter sp.]|uniref:cbb3-type cytochrome oxidase assembly protein CcoS n=1 Tax=Piscinibacter sp. TaxID=1903157 RepID=UPI000FDE9020|nr:cbb3-type cytochrome oxidase assembly protein CcoS [Piscinibacter defluvii]MCW5663940.1 cbb3-type cytochrome oxidase assembly protein CcoS [Piscinibacter sp.]
MDILYLLIPLSVVLVFLIIGVFAWAVNSGQFDDLEREGERILEPERPGEFPPPGKVDGAQGGQ